MTVHIVVPENVCYQKCFQKGPFGFTRKDGVGAGLANMDFFYETRPEHVHLSRTMPSTVDESIC